MTFPPGVSPEAQALIRLLDDRPHLLPNARFIGPDQLQGPWQELFGNELSSYQWSDVLERLASLRLVFTNGAAGHVGFGLTPLGIQVAKANRDSVPAHYFSPLTGTVFLSHSHRDNDFCRLLDRDLRNSGLQTWFDLNDLPVGDSIPAKIDYGMRNSNFVVLVFSKHSASSAWVKLEYETAITLETNGELDRFAVVKIDDEKLPPILARKSYVTFRTDSYSEEYRQSLTTLLSSLVRT
jgi:TIR domain